MIDIALIMACAPNVAPVTIEAIMQVESDRNPLAVNINTKQGEPFRHSITIRTERDAVRLVRLAMAAGHTVDMGPMQVNSTHLKRFGYTIDDMFVPCKNISAGASIIERAYINALAKYKNEQLALMVALSVYNTGSESKGFENGYVSRYFGKQSRPSVRNADTTIVMNRRVIRK